MYERVLFDRFMVKTNSLCHYIGNIINNAAFCSGVPHGFEICKNGRAVFIKLWFRLAQKINCKINSTMSSKLLYCILEYNFWYNLIVN